MLRRSISLIRKQRELSQTDISYRYYTLRAVGASDSSFLRCLQRFVRDISARERYDTQKKRTAPEGAVLKEKYEGYLIIVLISAAYQLKK